MVLTLTILLFSLLVGLIGATSSPTVATPLGIVNGFYSPDYNQDIFLGIPYAEPPGRFFPAASKLPWSGVLQATSYPPLCYQKTDIPLPLSENCLFLNVYSPRTSSQVKMPVMVWIHGGGFQDGSGSFYNGTHLAQTGIIIVTIQYRLGVLGFFQSKEIPYEHPSFPSYGGLNGIYDQVRALQWVQQNIQAFGGDPQQVTIFGESAGGLSICLLLAMKASKGLYQRALIESGSCLGPWGPGRFIDGLNVSTIIARSLNATTLAALRKLPPTAFLQTPVNIFPSVDNFLLTDLPLPSYLSGDLSLPADGALLVGNNALDTLFTTPWYNGPFPTNETYAPLLADYFGVEDAEKVLEYYPPLPTPKLAFQKLNAHLCVVCPTHTLVKLTSTLWPTFVYEFQWNPATPGYPGHFAEVPEVFGYQFSGWDFNPSLSATMQDYWTSFARTSVPQSTGSVEWQAFNPTLQNYVYFNNAVGVDVAYHKAECGFWDQYASTYANYVKMVEFCNQKKITQ